MTVGHGVATGVEVAVGLGVVTGVGVAVGLGVVIGVGVAVGLGVTAGDGIGVGVGLFTRTTIHARPIGVVPPIRNTLTISVCWPMATLVESQVKFPPPDIAEVPSTRSLSQ
jgi:hypothetical protein